MAPGNEPEWAIGEWEEAQSGDPNICQVKRYVEENVVPKRQ